VTLPPTRSLLHDAEIVAPCEPLQRVKYLPELPGRGFHNRCRLGAASPSHGLHAPAGVHWPEADLMRSALGQAGGRRMEATDDEAIFD
jgi:hypothetical protein